jgi:N utilization substance protein B
MQGLYEWHVSNNAPTDVLLHLHEEQEMKNVDREYLSELVLTIPNHVEELDRLLSPFLSRPIIEIDPVELAIVRLAAYEFAHRPDIPYRVVINEAVELAKKFGAEQSHKFVNAVLDKLAMQVRATEIKARPK